jgi:hypothetical protein
MPVALIAVVVGIVVGQFLGIAPPLPQLEFGLHLPHLTVPSWQDIVHGTTYAVLPQIPLTLTNAIIVTAAVSRQFFPKELHPVNERNLAITIGLGNFLAAPFGGYLMCHGAGGIAGHMRFGARTAARLRSHALRSCRATPRRAGRVVDPECTGAESLGRTHRGRRRSQQQGRRFGAISVGRFTSQSRRDYGCL